jgi:hypothetical protein
MRKPFGKRPDWWMRIALGRVRNSFLRLSATRLAPSPRLNSGHAGGFCGHSRDLGPSRDTGTERASGGYPSRVPSAPIRCRCHPSDAHAQLVAKVDNPRHRAEVDNAGHGRDY